MPEPALDSSRDLVLGVKADSIADGGMILGHVGKDHVVLARTGGRFFAVGAQCTHYHGPLAEGLVVGNTVRCPWHHACFSLETGEALRAPALDPVACWRVERQGDKVFVREKIGKPRTLPGGPVDSREHPSSIVIVGGGAAGLS